LSGQAQARCHSSIYFSFLFLFYSKEAFNVTLAYFVIPIDFFALIRLLCELPATHPLGTVS
jgi:hypothetical protein